MILSIFAGLCLLCATHQVYCSDSGVAFGVASVRAKRSVASALESKRTPRWFGVEGSDALGMALPTRRMQLFARG